VASLPVAGSVVAFLYLSWGFYPFVLLFSRARLLTFVAIAMVIVMAGLMAMLMPVEPPWRTGAVLRAVSVVPVFGAIASADVSPVAAFPSVHVAVPVVVAFLEGIRAKGRAWAWYALVTAVVVVLAGEHWMLDCLAGVLLALLVVLLVSICGGLTVWARSVIAVCRRESVGTAWGCGSDG